MPVVWSDSDSLKLVTLYSEHECLWNPLHPNFKRKLFRYKAYKNIADRMNISGLTVCDCMKRIACIKAEYCYELFKISAAICCEKLYKPRASWFPIVHQLFFPFTRENCINDLWKIRDDKSDVFNDCHREERDKQWTRSTSMKLDVGKRDCDCPYANCHCDESCITEFRARAKKISAINVESNRGKSTNREDSGKSEVVCMKSKCTTSEVYLKDDTSVKSNWKDANGIGDIQTEEDGNGKKNIHDEFDMFGKSVAFQLRNMDFDIAIKLEKRIQDLIAQERLDNMKAKCSECYSLSNCSECKIIRKKMVCRCGLPMIMIKTGSVL